MTVKVCEVQTCERPQQKKAMCSAHYLRLRKLGDVRADVPLRPRYVGPKRTACGVDGCVRPNEGNREWCTAHRGRLIRLGDAKAEQPIRAGNYQRSAKPARPGRPPIAFDEECTYHTAHHRVRYRRGRASFNDCITCGDEARQWAYRGNAAHEFSGDVNGSYLYWSGNPADYDPMCIPCHKRHDALFGHFRWLEEISTDLASQVRKLLQER